MTIELSVMLNKLHEDKSTLAKRLTTFEKKTNSVSADIDGFMRQLSNKLTENFDAEEYLRNALLIDNFTKLICELEQSKVQLEVAKLEKAIIEEKIKKTIEDAMR